MSQKKIRKHSGIHQIGGNKGKLKKGHRYTGQRTKTGLAVIKKVKTKMNKQSGGSDHITKFQYNGKTMTLVGVHHDESPSFQEISKIVDYVGFTRDACLLVEIDSSLNQKLLKSFKFTSENDYTTYKLWPQLKKHHMFLQSLCIKGWDIRPSLLGNDVNYDLYQENAKSLTIGQIDILCRAKLKSSNLDYLGPLSEKSKNFITGYYKFLKNPANGFIGKGNPWSDLIETLEKNGAEWHELVNWKLVDVWKHMGHNTDIQRYVMNMEKIVISRLKERYAEISDVYILQKILLAENNYVIIMGFNHLYNIRNRLKQLGINYQNGSL